MGREVTLFDLKKPTYHNVLNAIRTGENLTGTIEVDPSYGMYHFDGHRAHNISYSPQESAKRQRLCEVCNKEVTIGVASRVEELADRPEGYRPKDAKWYVDLLPLMELIAGVNGSALASKKNWATFNDLLKAFPNEFNILLDASPQELLKVVSKELVDVILQNRAGKIPVKPGYDGTYGVPIIGGKELRVEKPAKEKPLKEAKKDKKQTGLDHWS
jgi:PHP family Zn ribbon phosphoesterase